MEECLPRQLDKRRPVTGNANGPLGGYLIQIK